MTRPLHGVLPLVLLLAAPAGMAEELQFCGYAYGQEDGRYRYTEVHRQQVDNGRWVGGSIDYIAADGSRIGRKTLDFASNPTIPQYRLELFDGRYVEGIEAVNGKEVVVLRKLLGDAEPQRKTIAYDAPAGADSGFHAVIRQRLPDLLQGQTARFSFIVAGALDQFRFRVRRAGELTFAGRKAVRLVGEPDTLLRWLVDPLQLVYDPVNGQLLEYRGPTNLVDPKTGDGYPVRISFPSEIPADAPGAAVRDCRASPALPTPESGTDAATTS